VFDWIRYRRHDGKVFLYAFDLIELDGDDLRREPLDVRKATLRSLLTKTGPGLPHTTRRSRWWRNAGAHPCRDGISSGLARMFETRKVVHLADLSVEQAYLKRDPETVAAVELGGIRTVLFVPMLKEDEMNRLRASRRWRRSQRVRGETDLRRREDR
jgi:hypothetical protein